MANETTSRHILQNEIRIAGAWLAAVLLPPLMTPVLPFAGGHAAAQAAAPDIEGISLQVSPSPLTATLKPGTKTDLELRIRNTGNRDQALKMGMRTFTVDETTGQVRLQKTEPPEARHFVTFGQPAFSLRAGEIVTQAIHVDTPSNAGFTYSFAVTVSQQDPPKAKQGNTAIAGNVAVFTLLSVDRPGASRQLRLESVAATHGLYEYLPAAVNLRFRNSGNTLVQPKGTVYIQRHGGDTKPLAALQINEQSGYILPGNTRIFRADWKDGLPHYEQQADAAGNAIGERTLSWKGGDLSKIRFGRYVAKVVAVYDDGGRDVPLEAEVSFWVIPWRILGVVLLVLILAGVGIFVTVRRSARVLKRKTVKKDEA